MTMIKETIVALADVKEIKVFGTRWTDVHNNTYHACYVSALIGDEWKDIGSVDCTYGYEREYEATALKILKECVTGFNPSEESLWRVADELGVKIDSDCIDVKRKKDM